MPVKLPAGLEDSNIEIYAYEGNLKVIFEGKVIMFDELPADIINMLYSVMYSEKEVIKAFHRVKIIDPEEQLKMFMFCRFGGFNNEPDLDSAGKFKYEYWDCGIRNTCLFGCAICKGIMGENGPVSNREIEIIRIAQKGLLNKEIAAFLNISVNTVNCHMENIFHKINVNNRAELLNWAIKMNII